MRLIAAIFFTGLGASSAVAGSPFDATWRADLSATKFDQRPEFLLLKDGIYECRACTPPISIAADGQPHSAPGRDYADAMSATVVDERTMIVASYKAGRKYAEFTRTLSADGNLMTTVARSSNNPAGEWKTSTSQLKRVGPAPAGSHAQSGYWSPVAAQTGGQISFTLKLKGQTMSMRDSDGSSYVAQFGGAPAPIADDSSGGMVALRRLSKTSFEETNFVRGRKIAVNVYAITHRDTLTITSRNLRSGYTDTYVLHRQ